MSETPYAVELVAAAIEGQGATVPQEPVGVVAGAASPTAMARPTPTPARRRAQKPEVEVGAEETPNAEPSNISSASDAGAANIAESVAPGLSTEFQAGVGGAQTAMPSVGGVLSFPGLVSSPTALFGAVAGFAGISTIPSGGGGRSPQAPVNGRPIAGADTGAATEDGAGATGSIATNDSDPDGDALTFVLTAPVAGLAVAADGSWTFDPANAAYQDLALGETRVVTATYTMSDGKGGSATATLSITVTGTNDGPTAAADAFAVVEDAGVVTGTVAANDADIDGDALTYALVAPVDGLTFNADGSYRFDPSHAGYQGLGEGETRDVVVPYTISDGHGGTAETTLTIRVTGVADLPPNHDPVALADVAAATEDGPVLSGSVATNDSDSDGDTLTYRLVEPIAGLTFNADGGYSFDPAHAAYQGLAQGQTREVVVHYVVTDERGASAASTLTLTLTGANDAPIATADTAAGREDGVVSGSVAANDADADAGAALTYALVEPVAGLTMRPDGRYTLDLAHSDYRYLAEGRVVELVIPYTVTDEHGATTTSSLTVTVSGSNDAPVANSEAWAYAEDEGAVLGNVSGNDGDEDVGDQLTYALVAPVAGLTLDAAGWYRFNPGHAAYQDLAEGQTRVVVATYTLADNHGGEATATLTFTLTGTNDTPLATADSLDLNEDAGVVIGSVAANDADADAGAVLSYALVQPVAGLTLDADGNYRFDPRLTEFQALALGESRQITVAYTVTDEHGATGSSTLTLTVTGANDAPTATVDAAATTEDAAVIRGSVAANDGDVDAGAVLTYALTSPVPGLTLNTDGSYTFDPSNAAYDDIREGETRQVAVTYVVTDERGAAATSTLTLSVAGVNSAPTAQNDQAVGVENGVQVEGSVAGNDADPDGDVLTYALTAPVAGLLLRPDGSYVFNPHDSAYDAMIGGEERIITATYEVSDGHGGSSAASLVIRLTGTNDAPRPLEDTATAIEDGASVTGSVASNDGDPDSPSLTYEVVGILAGLTMAPDGSYTFDPTVAAYQDIPAGETRDVWVAYRVTDDSGASTLSRLTFTVTGANDAPVGVTDSYVVVEDGVLTITRGFGVLANDRDADSDALTVTVDTPPAHGALTLNPSGSFTYSPDANYSGPDSFTYIPSDGSTDGAPVTVNLTVAPVNDLSVNFATVASGYGPAGGEQMVNTEATGEQSEASVAGLVGGGYVITWTDQSGIGGDNSERAVKAQRYNAAGQPLGGEVLVNTTTTGDQSTSNITGLSNGGYVITWTDDTADGQVMAQIFDANGTRVGGEFVVHSQTGLQWEGDVTALSGGGFVVTWTDYSGDIEDGGGIRAQIFDASGAPVGGQIVVNTTEADDQYEAQVSTSPDGGFVVAWLDYGTRVAFMQRFDASGAKVGPEVPVSSAGHYTVGVSVTVLENGDTVVAWTRFTIPAFDSEIYTQVYDVAGNPVGSATQVGASTPPDQYGAQLTALADGGFVLVWQDAGNTGDGYGASVKAQRFDAKGEPVGTSFVVNSITAGFQGVPQVTALANGGFTVTWEDNSGQGDPDGSIKTQVYGPIPPFSATEQEALDLKGKIEIADIDGGAPSLTVTLSVDHGVLTMSAGNSGAMVSGSGTSSVTITGSRAQINALLGTGGSSVASFTSTGDTPPGEAVISVVISDGTTQLGQGTQVVTITAVNDAPVLGADPEHAVHQNDPILTGSVAGNDSDPEGDDLTYAAAYYVQGFQLNADGTYSFDPSAWRSVGSGPPLRIVIDFNVTDPQGATTPGQLIIEVTGENDAPVANVLTRAVTERLSDYTGNLPTSDIDDLVRTHTLLDPMDGLTLDANGSYQFNTAPYAYLAQGETLVVTARYRVSDPEGLSSESTISFTITGTSAGPTFAAAEEGRSAEGSEGAGVAEAPRWQVDAALGHGGEELIPVGLFNGLLLDRPAFSLAVADLSDIMGLDAGDELMELLAPLDGTFGARPSCLGASEFNIPHSVALDPSDPLLAAFHTVLV